MQRPPAPDLTNPHNAPENAPADALLPPLPRSTYQQPTILVARALIGATLVHRAPDGLTAGVIVETEAYVAAIDPAAHAYRGLTRRNQTMFGPPGYAYIYLSYGIHICLNIVTERAGEAAAVLIRALAPTHGLALMRQRRGPRISDRNLCRGPGRLCQALGVTLPMDGADLLGPTLWLAATPNALLHQPIAASPRIGITQAVDWPWRFYIPGNPHVSARPA